MIFEFFPAPSARKETAVIGFPLEVNLEYPRYLSVMKNHTDPPAEGFVASIPSVTALEGQIRN
jgi:hypothetical protein